jgi:hypothetical protein
MSNRSNVFSILENFFEAKGKFLTSHEYAEQTDAPIRIQMVRKIFGTWNNLEKLYMARRERSPRDESTNVNEVLAARNEELEAARILAAENLENAEEIEQKNMAESLKAQEEGFKKPEPASTVKVEAKKA